MLIRIIYPIKNLILAILEWAFAITRDKSIPPYPYDKKSNTIHLPKEVKKELRDLVLTGKKVDAVKRVTKLTGASLRLSKDYVDDLPMNGRL